jgi:hypothetical protein
MALSLADNHQPSLLILLSLVDWRIPAFFAGEPQPYSVAIATLVEWHFPHLLD